MRSVPMLKCSSERCVCAPQSLSAGTATSPRLSVSVRTSAMCSPPRGSDACRNRPEAHERGVRTMGSHHQKRVLIAVPNASGQGELIVLPERLDALLRPVGHTGRPVESVPPATYACPRRTSAARAVTDAPVGCRTMEPIESTDVLGHSLPRLAFAVHQKRLR